MPIIRSLFVDYLYRTVKDCNGSYRLILSRERSLVKKQNEPEIDPGSFHSCLAITYEIATLSFPFTAPHF